MRNSDLKNYRGFWQMWVKLVVIYSITIINKKKIQLKSCYLKSKVATFGAVEVLGETNTPSKFNI